MYLAGGAHEPPDRGGSMGRPTPTARRTEGIAVVRTATDLAALSRMTGAELGEKYLVLFGQPSRSRNKDYLRKRLAWRIQELTEGVGAQWELRGALTSRKQRFCDRFRAQSAHFDPL